MQQPNFRRRKTFLCVQTALAALAFSMPMTAGADNVIVTIDSGEDFSTGSPNADHWHSSDVTRPGLTNTTGTIGPNASNSLSLSHNSVTINGWDDRNRPASVVGGGAEGYPVNDGSIDNHITINNDGSNIAHITGNVIGGLDRGYGKNIDGNTVTLNGGTIGMDVYGGFSRSGYGVYSAYDNTVSRNAVTLNAGTVNGNIVGGGTLLSAGTNATAESNTVTISGGTVGGYVYGGETWHGAARNNTVTISGGEVQGDVIGGAKRFTTPNAAPVTATVNTVTGNTVNIIGGTVGASGKAIVGGRSTYTDVTKNTVIITGTQNSAVTIKATEIIGGLSINNTSKVGGTADDANKVIISNSHSSALALSGDVIGGKSETNGVVQYNEVSISGNVTSNKSVYGGYVAAASYSGNTSSHNTVTLDGFQQTGGSIYGGYLELNTGWGDATPGDATNNTVNIQGTTTVGSVYGGWRNRGTGDVFTGNALNKGSAASTISSAQNFANVNFNYDGNAGIGALITTPTGSTQSGIKLDVANGSNTITFNGNITGSGALEKTGAGTLAFSSGRTYSHSGATTVSAGTLKLGTDAKLTGAGAVGVNSGAALEAYKGSGITANLNAAAGSTLKFWLDNTVAHADTLLTVGGTATLADNTRVVIGIDGYGPTLSVGNYIDLIAASTLGADISNLNISATGIQGVGLSYDFTVSNENNQRLRASVVTAQNPSGPPLRTTPTTLDWSNAASNGLWDIGGAINWTDTANANAASQYINGDTVRFGNTGAGTVSIIAGGVSPAETSFNNTTGHDYVLDGVIAGTGGLTLTGGGNVTLSGANTYSGNTQVNAGALALGGSLSNSNVNVANGASLYQYGSIGQNVTLAAGASGNFHDGATIRGNLDAAGALLNFYLPGTFAANDTLLTVSGTANITTSTVNVGILGSASPLKNGDIVALLDAGTLTGVPANTIANGTGLQGVGLTYEFAISTSGNRLLAQVQGAAVTPPTPPVNPNPPPTPPVTPTPPVNPPVTPTPPVTPPSGPTVDPGVKAFAEGFLSGLTTLESGADLVADVAILQAADAAQSGLHVFGAVSGGKLRFDSGSNIKSDSHHLVAGVSAGRDLSKARVTVGGFFEYGKSDYDTNNSFPTAARVRGSGNTDYTGAGVLGRVDFAATDTGRFYAEATANAGRVSTDFGSSDLRDAWGRRAAFDLDATYYGASFGAGYVLPLDKQSDIQLYGKYLWLHEDGDKTRASTGDELAFGDAESSRLRLGAKYARALSSSLRLYAGLAWEHEFDGEVVPHYYGYRVDSPELEGGTTIGSFGLNLSPLSSRALTLDVGIQGYTGQREGVTGSFKGNYRF
ncbi:MAG: autotransporter domain-containing protein [Azoarcus sp.]|jgi:autotransporter-associated beta strand protein|nr:autotransporter domain-containing protein [Azoarcus sp.]